MTANNAALQYLVALVLAAVVTACMGAPAFDDFPQATMCTITADCGPRMNFSECWDFMGTFKWPLTSFRAEGPVTFLTKPKTELMVATDSFVLFNANYTANWTVEITYAEAPNKPGFSLRAGYDKTADSERDYITATIDQRHFTLVVPPTGAIRLPCPGSPASAQCTMHYFPIVLRYTGA